MARPNGLTPGVQERILENVRLGLPYKIAAEAAGVSESAFYKWKKRGLDELKRLEGNSRARVRKAERVYVEFVEALTRANAEAEATLVRDISTDADWRAKMTILERRFPERWAKIERRDVNVKGALATATVNADDLAAARAAAQTFEQELFGDSDSDDLTD